MKSRKKETTEGTEQQNKDKMTILKKKENCT